MAYYIYRHWVAEKKAVIHTAHCSRCNHGKGCHANPLGDKNGKWFGPYMSLEDAEIEAKQAYKGKILEFRKCSFCL